MIIRVLESCFAQRNLPASFEVVLVDSGSSPALNIPETLVDRVALVREDLPGLGRARARGIRETRGDTLVFLDDDTVLERDYLARATSILDERPYLGIIGGQLLPEFEGPLLLPERYYWERLALRRFSGNHWSNRWDDFTTSPIGGGMVLRRDVAERWRERFEVTPWRQALGRNGQSMMGAEDVDQNRTACDMGYGTGVFEELKVIHIMPRHRLEPGFLVKITEGNTRSWAFIRGMLDLQLPPPPRTAAHRVKIWVEACRKRGIERQLVLAEDSGTWQGWTDVAEWRRTGIKT